MLSISHQLFPIFEPSTHLNRGGALRNTWNSPSTERRDCVCERGRPKSSFLRRYLPHKELACLLSALWCAKIFLLLFEPQNRSTKKKRQAHISRRKKLRLTIYAKITIYRPHIIWIQTPVFSLQHCVGIMTRLVQNAAQEQIQDLGIKGDKRPAFLRPMPCFCDGKACQQRLWVQSVSQELLTTWYYPGSCPPMSPLLSF